MAFITEMQIAFGAIFFLKYRYLMGKPYKGYSNTELSIDCAKLRGRKLDIISQQSASLFMNTVSTIK
jgi:hypothetical protein